MDGAWNHHSVIKDKVKYCHLSQAMMDLEPLTLGEERQTRVGQRHVERVKSYKTNLLAEEKPTHAENHLTRVTRAERQRRTDDCGAATNRCAGASRKGEAPRLSSSTQGIRDSTL